MAIVPQRRIRQPHGVLCDLPAADRIVEVAADGDGSAAQHTLAPIEVEKTRHDDAMTHKLAVCVCQTEGAKATHSAAALHVAKLLGLGWLDIDGLTCSQSGC